MIIIIQTNFFPLLKCLIYVINMNKLPIKLLVCTKHLTVEAHPFVGSNFQCFFNQKKEYLPHPISVYSPVLRRVVEYLPYTTWCKKNASVNIHKTQTDFEYSLRGIRTLHSQFWNKNWRKSCYNCSFFVYVLFVIELLS